MEYIVPEFYDHFHCIAGACPDTCCAGWQIMIDEKSMKKYKKMEGGFGNRLKNSIDPREKCFLQYNGRCAFLNEDNLCDIVTEAGESALCHTCRTYPRHIEEYENLREISLALSCPEAARMLLTRREPLQFTSWEKDQPDETYEDFDYMLFSVLTMARKVMIEILQNRQVSIQVRMGTVLALAHDMQRRIREGQLYLIQGLLEQYRKQGVEAYMAKITPRDVEGKSFSRYETMQNVYNLLEEMEALKPDWKPKLSKYKTLLYGRGEEEYKKLTKQWLDDVMLEQLMVYFVYTYFAGAVYDEQPYTKIKFSLISTLLIQELCFARTLEKEQPLNQEDMIQMAYTFAKEIEHSQENLDRFENQCRTNPELGILPMIYGSLYHG